MKTFVKHIDRLPAPDRRCLRAAIPEAIWQQVESANALTWLPFETNLVCTHAVAKCLGPERTHEFFSTLLLSTSKTPVLEGLVISVVRRLGNDHGAALYWIAKGFELLFKNSGTWRVLDRSPGSAELQVQGLPFAVASDKVWIDSVTSALSALFAIAKIRGHAEVLRIDPSTGRVVFRLATPQAAPELLAAK